jgi:hypothetical protein
MPSTGVRGLDRGGTGAPFKNDARKLGVAGHSIRQFNRRYGCRKKTPNVDFYARHVRFPGNSCVLELRSGVNK